MLDINFCAPLNKTSYGYVSYYLMKHMIQAGVHLTYFPISDPDDSMVQAFTNMWFGNRDRISKNAKSIRLWHEYGVHERVSGGTHYGFPIFERDKFSKIQLNSIKLCDEMITCSKWGADAITNETGLKCHVVPLGIDPDIFVPCENSKLSNTIFFNCGKWEKRKSHGEIIECFNKAFGPNDNVELWMMCENPFIGSENNDWVNYAKNSKLGDKIKILKRVDTQKNVYEIMKKADVGVFPSRAEGWNLELLEMMSIGKNVIATNYSAHTEFCNNKNCHLINIDKFEPAVDNKWFFGDFEWASIDNNVKDAVIEHMRFFHKEKQSGKLSINIQGIETGRKFTWNNSVQQLIKALSYV